MKRLLVWTTLALSVALTSKLVAADPVTTAAAAATTVGEPASERPPDFLELLVDSILGLFNMHESGNTAAHYTISVLLLVVALLARRIITGVVFMLLRRVASRTKTTFDDKLFPALETPAALLVVIIGIYSALHVLKLTPTADYYIASGSRVAFSLAIFWGLWRVISSALEHGNEIATSKGLAISGFMPWIKKTVMAVFMVVAVLLTIQSLGFDVKAILAGLGIGGLAFALAAQDTLANIFGAIVVAVDQPFKIGETVRIAGNVGTVEDIGLRSTRIRLVDRSLMVVPNKLVAAETITNLSRFTQRRTEQVIGLTYDTKPAELDAIVEDFKQIILAEADVDPTSVMVFFRDYAASSLDLWVVYVAKSPDFQASMRLRQRINIAFMRAVDARGLQFAFPTQTLNLPLEIVERFAAPRDAAPTRPASGD